MSKKDWQLLKAYQATGLTPEQAVQIQKERDAAVKQHDDLRESFVDFATSGINNLAPYCKNRCKGCVNERGWCLHDDCCRGFNPDGRATDGN